MRGEMLRLRDAAILDAAILDRPSKTVFFEI